MELLKKKNPITIKQITQFSELLHTPLAFNGKLGA